MCTFAINAPASGCCVIFDNVTLGSFGDMAFRSPAGSLLSLTLINIPQHILQQAIVHGLNNAVFNVKVYDINEEGEIMDSPAVEQRRVLEVRLVNPNSTFDMPVLTTGI